MNKYKELINKNNKFIKKNRIIKNKYINFSKLFFSNKNRIIRTSKERNENETSTKKFLLIRE